MNTRVAVHVATADDHWIAEFNGTYEDARAYFMGRVFERADETPHTPVVQVVTVGEPFVPPITL